jgi:tetratricopeptide (TPR) repeat protein
MRPGNRLIRSPERRFRVLRFLVGAFLIAGCLCSEAGASGPSADLEPRTDAVKREAFYHFFLGDYLTAATRLKLAEEASVSSEKDLNETRLVLGGLYISWGMYRPASVLFDRWVTQFPPGGKRNELLLLIERLQYRRALYRGAIDTYSRLIPDEVFPSEDYARYLTGMSHYMLGSFPDTIRLMEMIPETSGYFPYARMAMAQSHVQLNDNQTALSLLQELGGIDPSGDPAVVALTEKSRLNQGLLMIELGRYDDSRTALSSVPANSPFFPDALFGQGWAEFDAGRYAQALPYFQELVDRYPGNPYALEGLISIGGGYRQIGAAARSLQSYGEALQIYNQKENDIRKVRAWIRDPSRLAGWLDGTADSPENALERLLDDDRVRYQVSQYREVASLADYLDRKRDEMAVFRIMLDHREGVFRRHLPTLQRFLADDPVQRLRQRGSRLEARVQEAVRTEQVNALATSREREMLIRLDRATAEGTALEKAAARLSSRSREGAELKAQLTDMNRKLALLRGELRWSIITEAPGRIDDLRREAKNLDASLAGLDSREERLTASVPTMKVDLERFRQRIDRADRSLGRERDRALALRARLLPVLQASLLEALDQRQEQMERLAAAARLSQIQILDAKSRP